MAYDNRVKRVYNKTLMNKAGKQLKITGDFLIYLPNDFTYSLNLRLTFTVK
jgi:hypothetical protein